MQETTSANKIPKGQIEAVYTTAPVEAPKDSPAVLPIWIELPRTGTRCKYTSLSRSALNAWILGPNPPVRSVSLKKRYAVRGKRLIHLGSLLEFIARAAEAQNTTPTAVASATGGEMDQ